jgi:hypothetical protein
MPDPCGCRQVCVSCFRELHAAANGGLSVLRLMRMLLWQPATFCAAGGQLQGVSAASLQAAHVGSMATIHMPGRLDHPRGRALLQDPLMLEPLSSPGQCLSLPGGAGAAEGTPLVLATCAANAAQQWFVSPEPGGTMFLEIGDGSWNRTVSVGGSSNGSVIVVSAMTTGCQGHSRGGACDGLLPCQLSPTSCPQQQSGRYCMAVAGADSQALPTTTIHSHHASNTQQPPQHTLCAACHPPACMPSLQVCVHIGVWCGCPCAGRRHRAPGIRRVLPALVPGPPGACGQPAPQWQLHGCGGWHRTAAPLLCSPQPEVALRT